MLNISKHKCFFNKFQAKFNHSFTTVLSRLSLEKKISEISETLKKQIENSINAKYDDLTNIFVDL